MFWRMSAFTHSSPVDAILEKENFTLEDLLDEDEIIQECKALNTRLINFLREKAQVEKLLHYIVKEPPEDADKKHIFKFPFIACEIFTCEVDVILRSLIEDVELIDLLFSFIKPDQPHSTLSAGYFSKVVICLLMRKTGPFLNYVQSINMLKTWKGRNMKLISELQLLEMRATKFYYSIRRKDSYIAYQVHTQIIHQLVDLIGITSIMEVLIRLLGADEGMHSSYVDTMQWLDQVDVLEMIADKFSSSDSSEVHANATEILCAIVRCAPPVFAAKICSPSYVGRLFHHALGNSGSKSVLFHTLSFCICLLDPKRLVASSYQAFRSQSSHGSFVAASQDTVEGMLERLGDLLKLLGTLSTADLPTTYGKLQPPLGKRRLKIVEFISVLSTIGSEAVDKELISLGAIRLVLELFFEYPFNNFLHHHVENIIGTCLESKRLPLIEHVLHDCDIVGKILVAEKQPFLSTDLVKATISAEGRSPPRIGNLGHLTHIANKLIHLGNNNVVVQKCLLENADWVDWHSNVLRKRNAVENVLQWTCGRPTTLQDRVRDSDDDDFQDRNIDVAALANNLSQAFRCGIYSNDDNEEAQGSFDRDDEDVYFDDESAEVVISSLRLGDDQYSSPFTNSNWFAFENDRNANGHLTDPLASPSSNLDESLSDLGTPDKLVVSESKDLIGTVKDLGASPAETESKVLGNGNGLTNNPELDTSNPSTSESEKKPHGWVEWRETSDSEVPGTNPSYVQNGELELDKSTSTVDDVSPKTDKCQPSSRDDEVDRQGDVGPTNILSVDLPNTGGDSPPEDLSVSKVTNTESSMEPPASGAAAKDSDEPTTRNG